MFKNKKLSKNPLHYVYAVIWLVLFGSIAYYVYSGAAFKPENGKIHLVAILIAWVVEYLGLTITSLLFLLYGIYRAMTTVLADVKDNL
ncbi:hypothetical protein D3C81_1045320 [compost metagenome]|uniref:Uncharacterized protein n=1 Tax=Sphingobacterium paramultivorum TaxID=2886510 RepID=A0A7G5EAF5_9SPHI|nr:MULTISPECIES: hypothetical protein [Sphingobacterium]MCS4164074.1 hypothetical protein [Sphingobacterium sp. BIGb0116]QMV70980.1 hypothetical protein HS960_26525 [Sphingobacterium paramultivorum]WSO14867.1 hypothetical protein VUL84_26520 [Sphingobacterium paramultivorum]